MYKLQSELMLNVFREKLIVDLVANNTEEAAVTRELEMI